VNVIILSGNSIAGVAAAYTSLCYPARVHLILKGLRTQSRLLKFQQSPEYAKLRRRVWIRSTSAFFIMNFLFVYEPFVWPDYFLLLDLIGRLWSSVIIALLEMQIVCIADAFANLFRLLNSHLVSGKSSPENLRKIHDELCDFLYHFQVYFILILHFKSRMYFAIIFVIV